MDKPCRESAKNKDRLTNTGSLYKPDYVQTQGSVDKQGTWCIFVTIANTCSATFIEIRTWTSQLQKKQFQTEFVHLIGTRAVAFHSFVQFTLVYQWN